MTELAPLRERGRRAYLWACALDVAVRKPGNVSAASAGHDMHAAQFIESAMVSAEPLFEARAPVGKRIEGAIRATRAAVACNTNLGIVLLCAPLAAATEWTADAAATDPRASLQRGLHSVLAALDVDDARAAYRAIVLANPGGLGSTAEADVRDEPSIDLRAAMALASQRDRVARQYLNDFAEVFDPGVSAFVRFASEPALGMLSTWLAFLASDEDSHIVRKHGWSLAHSVTAEARRVQDAWQHSGKPPEPDALAAWDEQLKTRRLNPGTSADLAVAAAFVAGTVNPRLCDLPVPGLAWNVLNSRPTLTRLSG